MGLDKEDALHVVHYVSLETDINNGINNYIFKGQQFGIWVRCKGVSAISYGITECPETHREVG